MYCYMLWIWDGIVQIRGHRLGVWDMYTTSN